MKKCDISSILVCFAAIAAPTLIASPANAQTLPNPLNILNWTTQDKITGWSHIKELYATETIHAWSCPRPLKTGPLPAFSYPYGGKTNSIDDYFAHSKSVGLLVLKENTVVYERYAPGFTEDTLWESHSVAKAFLSTLVGVAIKNGAFHSLQDAIDQYVPELRRTAYHGVTLQNMLRMASGVAWNEDYSDQSSDWWYVYRCVANRTPNCVLPHMESLSRAIDPATGHPAVQGAVWNYNTGEAYLVGLALQRATGESLAEFLEDTVWNQFAMEDDGLFIRESDNGPDYGADGFNATLRDYARFGKFVLDNGTYANGSSGLSKNWVRDAITWTAASASPGYADNGQFGYDWWFNPSYDDGINMPLPLATKTPAPPQNTTASVVVPMTGTTADWTFAALGIFGQMVAINQLEHLVMVQWATWDRPDPVDLTLDPSDPYNEEAAILNALSDTLHSYQGQ